MKALHAVKRLGTKPFRFQFDIVVHRAVNLPDTKGAVFVSLTRGGKVAIGKAATVKDHIATWNDEKLSIIATLYKDTKSNSFQEKTAKISAKESLGKKGQKTIGSKTFNLSDFAQMGGSKDAELMLDDHEKDCKMAIQVTIHCVWIKEDVPGLDQGSEVSDMTHAMGVETGGDVSDDDHDHDHDNDQDNDLDDEDGHHHPRQSSSSSSINNNNSKDGKPSSISVSSSRISIDEPSPTSAASGGGLPPKMKKPASTTATSTNASSSSSSSSSSNSNNNNNNNKLLEKELESALHKYHDLEGSYKLLEQKYQSVASERDGLAKEVQMGKDQQEKDGKRIDKLLHRLEEAENATAEALAAANSKNNKTAAVSSQSPSDYQLKIQELHKEIDRLQEENDETIKILKEHHAEEKANLINKIKGNEANMANLTSSKTEVEKLESSLRLAKKEANDAEKGKEAAESKLREAEKTIATLREEIRSFSDKSDLIVARTKADILATRWEDDEDDDDLKGNMSDDDKRNDGSAARKSNSKHLTPKQLQAELDSIQNSLAAAEKQLQNSEKEKDDLVRDLVNTKLHYAEAEEQIDVLKKKLKTAVNDKVKISERMTALEIKYVEAVKASSSSSSSKKK